MLFEPFAAALVSITQLGVMPAVEFYNQALFEAAKVGDERSYGNLSAKFGAVDTSRTQVAPRIRSASV